MFRKHVLEVGACVVHSGCGCLLDQKGHRNIDEPRPRIGHPSFALNHLSRGNFRYFCMVLAVYLKERTFTSKQGGKEGRNGRAGRIVFQSYKEKIPISNTVDDRRPAPTKYLA